MGSQLTKIRITGFENITPSVRTKIARAIAQSGFQAELQKSIIEEIRDNGIKPDLSPATVRTRNYLAQFNETHPKYQTGKSNLTLTGQLLDSLRAKFVLSKLLFNVFAGARKHKKYKTGGKRSKTPAPTLAQIFEWQKEAGRDLAQIFSRTDFIKDLSTKLRDAIEKNYRN